MECGVSSNNGAPMQSKSSSTFMFTEERISSQLTDMKEQTDFMKRFRCALGIALREIKTLRTASQTESDETNSSVPHPETADLNTDATCPQSADDQHRGEFASTDLRILRDYLNKMEIGCSQADKYPIKSTVKDEHLSKMYSRTLIEKSIQHIERLKGLVENKNAMIKKLCQQLSQTRSIRVKRETKLEEKLAEISDWKERYSKTKRSYDKQVLISRNLRAALNSQKSKVQYSENMAQRLEETRKAFGSIKSQAGNLMRALDDKNYEIADLSAKIAELESLASPDIRQHNSDRPCVNCGAKSKELESLKASYKKVWDDFEFYRRNNPHTRSPESSQREYSQNHPYERRRMHAPYSSPESYRRVSRPPLRRRLNYSHHVNIGSGAARINMVGETLLSPIDEFVENTEDAGQNTTMNLQKQDTTSNHPVYDYSYHNSFQTAPEQSQSILHQASYGLSESPLLYSAEHNQYARPLPPPTQQENDLSIKLKSSEEGCSTGNNKTYLEVGQSTSSSPNTSTKSNFEVEPDPPLRMNSFIRREPLESQALDGSVQTGDEDSTFSDLPDSLAPIETFSNSFGVVWHPALKEDVNRQQLGDGDASTTELKLEKLDIDQKPSRLKLFGSDNKEGDDATSSCSTEKTSKTRSHCVTYQGHQIDVTNFSIHAFRDIVWSLEGGPDSADAFIKFLASTARKLNASPKWTGKHTMGKPSDWLSLRGLY